jgi:hypothetical protein
MNVGRYSRLMGQNKVEASERYALICRRQAAEVQPAAACSHLEQSGDDPGQVGEDVGEEEANMDLVSHTAHLPAHKFHHLPMHTDSFHLTT